MDARPGMSAQPRFFDLQVNGYGGVDFNQDNLSAEGLHRACARLAADGVDGILATIITEHLPQMTARIRRLADLRRADTLIQQIVAGIHIEGPFLNPADGYRGAHPADAVRPADCGVMEQLLDAGDGLVRLVTLAPECDPGLQVTRLLHRQGVAVAAGHTDASLEQLQAAVDAGLGMFTHVGNGCPAVLPRHDNIIQRALGLHTNLWLTFIADGAHVPWFVLRNYMRTAGLDRCVVVTDAIAPSGLGPGQYHFGRWQLNIGDDLVARSPDGSHLVGSVGTMARSYQKLVDLVGLSQSDARRLTCDNPRRALECCSGKSRDNG
jgi:N-acetylglucosamine-6-phosphate deacetylase